MGEAVEEGEGMGMGMPEGQKNMPRIIRPETSTHYTENVPNRKLEKKKRPSRVVAESRRIDKSKSEVQRNRDRETDPEGNDEMSNPENLQKSRPILTGGVHHSPLRFEMTGEARNGGNMYMKGVIADVCG